MSSDLSIGTLRHDNFTLDMSFLNNDEEIEVLENQWTSQMLTSLMRLVNIEPSGSNSSNEIWNLEEYIFSDISQMISVEYPEEAKLHVFESRKLKTQLKMLCTRMYPLYLHIKSIPGLTWDPINMVFKLQLDNSYQLVEAPEEVLFYVKTKLLKYPKLKPSSDLTSKNINRLFQNGNDYIDILVDFMQNN